MNINITELKASLHLNLNSDTLLCFETTISSQNFYHIPVCSGPPLWRVEMLILVTLTDELCFTHRIVHFDIGYPLTYLLLEVLTIAY